MVATAASLLVHVPPGVVLLKVVVAPTQTALVPVIAATTGNGLTVTVAAWEVAQPLLLVTVYVIVTVPADMPVTLPVLSTVAIAVLLLAHTPDGVVLDKVVAAPTQIEFAPVMTSTTGTAFTVIVVACEAVQPSPFVTVYVIVTVPADMPVTLPVLSIVAIAVLLLAHTPDGVVLDKVVAAPTQIEFAPVMASTTGSGLTVTVVV
jgi:hypothetical protein